MDMQDKVLGQDNMVAELHDSVAYIKSDQVKTIVALQQSLAENEDTIKGQQQTILALQQTIVSQQNTNVEHEDTIKGLQQTMLSQQQTMLSQQQTILENEESNKALQMAHNSAIAWVNGKNSSQAQMLAKLNGEKTVTNARNLHLEREYARLIIIEAQHLDIGRVLQRINQLDTTVTATLDTQHEALTQRLAPLAGELHELHAAHLSSQRATLACAGDDDDDNNTTAQPASAAKRRREDL